jgi:hypothetical protein
MRKTHISRGDRSYSERGVKVAKQRNTLFNQLTSRKAKAKKMLRLKPLQVV